MSNEIIKCNCCGGHEIEIKPHSRIGKCKSCGASVILPDLENHEVLALLDQAYIERSNFEFDKATSIYEFILTKNPNEVCAFEGLILCKYGITYVKDPRTGESVPTCHRYSPISIFDDQDFIDYLAVCPTEDEKNVFKKMGDDIANLQQEISKQLKNEKDYDIFISFKSKDKDGKSTEDALIARDLYDQLVGEGYEVFMSDVSLKGRINAEYEPIIYNALQTSEVFILVGTSKENIYSPWVRNEWSRFINIINTSGGRLNPSFFIPVYKNMSPYDMPRINNRNVQCVDASDLLYKKNISDYIKHLINPTNSHEKELTKEELERLKIQEEARARAEERDRIRRERFFDNINSIDDDDKKIEFIKMYPLSDNGKGILEFMFLATSNFDAEYYATNRNKDSLQSAWLSKIEQCYQKGKAILTSKSDIARLEDLYAKVHGSIIKVRKTKVVLIVLGFVASTIGLIIIYVFGRSNLGVSTAGLALITAGVVSLIFGFKRKKTNKEIAQEKIEKEKRKNRRNRWRI